MITREQLEEANAKLKAIDVKGKKYAPVSERVKAFREICPGGSITTQIIDLTDGVVTMQTTIMDEEGRVLATGLAQEKEQSSYINKTSFIENAETSACGRALGFAGIGIDGSLASAEEMANALAQQEAMKETITEKEQKILTAICERKGLNVSDTFPKGVENLTGEDYITATKKLNKLPDKA